MEFTREKFFAPEFGDAYAFITELGLTVDTILEGFVLDGTRYELVGTVRMTSFVDSRLVCCNYASDDNDDRRIMILNA